MADNATEYALLTPCDNCTGLILPLFVETECGWNQGIRATLYLIALLWSFLGISQLADCFMCSIEKITNMSRVEHQYKTVQDPLTAFDRTDREKATEVYVGTKIVKFWNETVANLTLMALGSSAPEILLSCIEIVGNSFRSGELGPGTIVGSAAFNLLVITAVCIGAIPSPAIRRIKRVGVFAITAFFSIFAYVWLLLIISVITPGVVDLWEAVITFAFFPILVIIAFICDRLSHKRELRKEKYKKEKRHGQNDIKAYIQEMRKTAPHLSDDEITQLAKAKFMKEQHSSRAWYRINASRMLAGGNRLAPSLTGNLDKVNRQYERRKLAEEDLDAMDNELKVIDGTDGATTEKWADCPVISFEKRRDFAMEEQGTIEIVLERSGKQDEAVTVTVETVEGTAKQGEDYIYLYQSVQFAPGETRQSVRVTIIDDAEYEDDEVFFIRIIPPDSSDNWILGNTALQTVVIIDGDHPGKVSFLLTTYEISDRPNEEGVFKVPLQRSDGLTGSLDIKYKTIPLTAQPDIDYEEVDGVITFKEGEMEKFIDIPIKNTTGEKKVYLSVELSDDHEGDLLGANTKCLITIVDDEFWSCGNKKIEEKVKTMVDNLGFGASWREQFDSALNVNGGNIESASVSDYVLHIVSFGWKLIGAFVPPTNIAGGWLAFTVSLIFVGILTAIVGDLAGIFGCIVGLKNSVTAITLVALGTSLPDTFASYIAATNEDTADAAIGNITGSNSVNVFLGLGLPWFIAAIYHTAKQTPGGFKVESGSLGFSVMIYSITAVIAISILFIRRKLSVVGRAELGGNKIVKYICVGFFVSMWFFYITMSTLKAYKVIK